MPKLQRRRQVAAATEGAIALQQNQLSAVGDAFARLDQTYPLSTTWSLLSRVMSSLSFSFTKKTKSLSTIHYAGHKELAMRRRRLPIDMINVPLPGRPKQRPELFHAVTILLYAARVDNQSGIRK
jgi:hypothetical protein